MFLYFSDWTSEGRKRQIFNNTGIHTEKIIKVYASDTNPTKLLKRDLSVLEVEGREFNHDYPYLERNTFTPQELEDYLATYQLPEEARQRARSLFRFANLPHIEIAQFAMSIENAITRTWHFAHPLRIIHGLDKARDRRSYQDMHLDVFTPRSIEKVARLVDLESKVKLVSVEEIVEIKQALEGRSPHKETLY